MCGEDEYLDKLRELTPKLAAFVTGDADKNVIEYDTPVGTVIGFGLLLLEEVAVGRFFLSKHAIFPRHHHDQTEFLLPYTGSLEVTVGSGADTKSKTYTAGEVCILPPWTPHYAEALEDTYIVAVTVPADRRGYPGD